uniref:Uncharacterized protein n=1 Tax=Caenorhabditis japonica TaxID=281687 RepID=A0A8R1EUG5_CAEJA
YSTADPTSTTSTTSFDSSLYAGVPTFPIPTSHFDTPPAVPPPPPPAQLSDVEVTSSEGTSIKEEHISEMKPLIPGIPTGANFFSSFGQMAEPINIEQQVSVREF